MPTRLATDRVAGLAGLALAAVTALETRTFRVTSLVDPIGPRALPWLAAFLIGAGALVLLLRPAANEDAMPPGTLRRIVVAVLVFLAYAGLIAPIGFFAATTLLGVALSLQFGARPVPALLAAAAFSGALWLLFALALGLPLPAGELFFGRG